MYVHCVMHKCITVKIGGNEIHVKHVKTREFFENKEGEFVKVGRENNNFSETGGNRENRRKIQK